MTRNIAWGSLAILPMTIFLYCLGADTGKPDYVPNILPATEFWAEYWFIAVSTLFTLSGAIFFIHSIFSSAWLWATGMVILPFPTIPAYWWLRSE